MSPASHFPENLIGYGKPPELSTTSTFMSNQSNAAGVGNAFTTTSGADLGKGVEVVVEEEPARLLNGNEFCPHWLPGHDSHRPINEEESELNAPEPKDFSNLI